MKRVIVCSLILGVLLVTGAFATGRTDVQSDRRDNPGLSAPMAKFVPTVTLTSVHAAHTPVDPDITLDNNEWVRTYANRLGIEVEYLWTAGSANDRAVYDQRVSLTVAAGDIPDFMQVSVSQFDQMKRAGLLADISEAVDNFSIDLLQREFEALPDVVNVVRDGDKMLGLPRFTLISASMMASRQDWREKLGLPVPQTLDDLVELARAFTFNDPDGDGVNDTVGFSGKASDQWNSLLFFFNAYHAYPKIWVDDGRGGMAYGSIQPEIKDALARLQELFKEGVIDPEFAIQAGWPDVMDLMNSSQLGIIASGQWIYAGFSPLIEKQPDAWFDWYKHLSADDQPAKAQSGLPINSVYVLSKDATYEQQAAVVKMANLWLEKTWRLSGPEEFAQFIDTEYQDQFVYLRELAAVEAGSGLEHYILGSDVQKHWDGKWDPGPGDIQQATFIDDVNQYVNHTGTQFYQFVHWGDGGTISTLLPEMIDGGRIVYDRYNKVPTDTMAQKWSVLQDLEDETFAQIIAGELPVDAFDAFVTQWKSLGGDTITRELNSR